MRKKIAIALLPVLIIVAGVVFGYFAFYDDDIDDGPQENADSLEGLTCIDIGDNGFFYLGTTSEIRIHDSQWNLVRVIPSVEPVTAVAADVTGNIYAAVGGTVEKYSPEGEFLLKWGKVGDEFEKFEAISGLVCSGENVFVADAGSRAVYRFAADGHLLNTIDGRGSEQKRMGFVVPSACLDVDVANGILYVNNPGRFRVERYDFDGNRLDYWEDEAQGSGRFPGCCNPIHLATVPGGDVVVSQKGEPCLKVFSPDGVLLEELARGDFDQNEKGMDLAVDSSGRFYAIDSLRGKVRIFERGSNDR